MRFFSVVMFRYCCTVRCCAVRCSALRCGAVRCGAVRCGKCGAVKCGADFDFGVHGIYIHISMHCGNVGFLRLHNRWPYALYV